MHEAQIEEPLIYMPTNVKMICFIRKYEIYHFDFEIHVRSNWVINKMKLNIILQMRLIESLNTSLFSKIDSNY